MLHDRSRQSTKTCAECHTYSLVGYGGGILDDLFQYLHLYEVMRGDIESKGFFRWYKGSYELLGIEQDIPCDLFSELCVFLCVLKFIFSRHFSLFCVLCLLCVFLKYVLIFLFIIFFSSFFTFPPLFLFSCL